MENISEAQIAKIQDEGETEWYQRVMRADDRQMQAYYSKKESWFEGDRFILHPELYKKQIRGYVTEELPELLATYVRGQFRGSTEKITIVRIKEVCAAMIEENPNWWHSPNRKKIFLERFRLAYPKCCDGEKPTKSSENKTAPPIPKGKNAKQQKSGCTVLLVLILLAACRT